VQDYLQVQKVCPGLQQHLGAPEIACLILDITKFWKMITLRQTTLI